MNKLYARLCCVLSTWFGVGYAPMAPGSWGSLAALPLCVLLYYIGQTPAVLGAAAVLLIIGIISAKHYAAHTRTHDPQSVVIDEVVGQLITLAFIPPSWLWYGIGFALFRAADIVKPWPACYIDKRWSHGYGIMGDDVVAGLYAASALAVIQQGVGG